MISTIYKGYKITEGGQTYEVVGSQKIRKTYRYLIQDIHGRVFSLRREALLAGQANGSIQVSL